LVAAGACAIARTVSDKETAGDAAPFIASHDRSKRLCAQVCSKAAAEEHRQRIVRQSRIGAAQPSDPENLWGRLLAARLLHREDSDTSTILLK
jgi:hypothetical protein